ncbi:hypothetical protein [Microcoleus sp. CAWBG58]|uniref:hypothetical protein n=1 Tax=Microcoleus sp. CAWBG58 TaxID=2841651 RepID=UPI0025E9CB63|nr:hypothetical protein [Microcoleus sp. CAWBG58]
MNSLVLISPSKTWGFQPIVSGNKILDFGFWISDDQQQTDTSPRRVRIGSKILDPSSSFHILWESQI